MEKHFHSTEIYFIDRITECMCSRKKIPVFGKSSPFCVRFGLNVAFVLLRQISGVAASVLW